MLFNDCINFANNYPICNVATVEGDQPRTRIFSMWYADESGFYFHTGAMKSVAKQIKAHPKVELCFYAPAEPPAVGETLRVSGEVEILNDMKIKEKLLKERPFLKLIGISGPDDPSLLVFRIAHGEAYIWTMANNGRESAIERVKF